MIKYKTKKRRSIYTILEDADHVSWHWDTQNVLEFDTMINAGLTLKETAQHFGVSVDECILLAVDRCRKKKIKKRLEVVVSSV